MSLIQSTVDNMRKSSFVDKILESLSSDVKVTCFLIELDLFEVFDFLELDFSELDFLELDFSELDFLELGFLDISSSLLSFSCDLLFLGFVFLTDFLADFSAQPDSIIITLSESELAITSTFFTGGFRLRFTDNFWPSNCCINISMFSLPKLSEIALSILIASIESMFFFLAHFLTCVLSFLALMKSSVQNGHLSPISDSVSLESSRFFSVVLDVDFVELFCVVFLRVDLRGAA